MSYFCLIGKNLNMTAFFFAYFLTFIVFLIAIILKNKRFYAIIDVKLTKYGLVFYSNNRHRIKIHNAKMLIIENNVYLKKNNRTVVLKNVDKVSVNKDYLYFNSLGKTQIIMNCKKFYKYFVVQVESEDFDIEELKENAIQDILNNIFDFNNCIELKRYLKIMREILKIDLENDHVKLTKNNYELSYTLTYILNGVKKRVYVK